MVDAADSLPQKLATRGPLSETRPKSAPKPRGPSVPVTTPAKAPAKAPEQPHGQLGSELPPERTSLQWERRWGSWQKDAVEVGACIWADLKVEGAAGDAAILSKLKREIERKLNQALGADAVVAILDDEFETLQRLFVCLLAKAEECTELRSTWKNLKLLDAAQAVQAVTVSWKDTIDTASHNHVPHLKECWNPKRLTIDSMSLALPARWAFDRARLPNAPPVACVAGSHWHGFAQVFGEVVEAFFTWKGEKTETVHLVVRYVKGPKSAYSKLTGRCLSNPLSSKGGKRDVCLVRAVYGTFAGLLDRISQQEGRKAKMWIDTVWKQLLPRPEGASAGPVFELFPLQPQSMPTLQKAWHRLLLTPWGPSHFLLGRSDQCQLRIFHEGISNEHAELFLMVPWKQQEASHLAVFVTDKSKNGTYVNGQRLTKDAVLQLKEGDALRLADVPTYVTWLYDFMRQLCV